MGYSDRLLVDSVGDRDGGRLSEAATAGLRLNLTQVEPRSHQLTALVASVPGHRCVDSGFPVVQENLAHQLAVQCEDTDLDIGIDNPVEGNDPILVETAQAPIVTF